MWYLIFLLVSFVCNSYAMDPNYGQYQPGYYDQQQGMQLVPVFVPEGYFPDPMTGTLKPYGHELLLPMPISQMPYPMPPMPYPMPMQRQMADISSDENSDELDALKKKLTQLERDVDAAASQVADQAEPSGESIVAPTPIKKVPSPVPALEAATRQASPPAAAALVKREIKKETPVAERAAERTFNQKDFEAALHRMLKPQDFATYDELNCFRKKIELEMKLQGVRKKKFNAYFAYASLQLFDFNGNEKKRIKEIEDGLDNELFSRDAASAVRLFLSARERILAAQKNKQKNEEMPQEEQELAGSVEEPAEQVVTASYEAMKKEVSRFIYRQGKKSHAQPKRKQPSIKERIAQAKKKLGTKDEGNAIEQLNSLFVDETPLEQYLEVGELLAQQFDPLFGYKKPNAAIAGAYYKKCRDRAGADQEMKFLLREIFCAYAADDKKLIEESLSKVQFQEFFKDVPLLFATGVYGLMSGDIEGAAPLIGAWERIHSVFVPNLYRIFQSRLDNLFNTVIVPMRLEMAQFNKSGIPAGNERTTKRAVVYLEIVKFYHRIKKLGLGSESIWKQFDPEQAIFELANASWNVPAMRYVLTEYDLLPYLQLKFIDVLSSLPKEIERWQESVINLQNTHKKFTACAMQAKWAWREGKLQEFFDRNQDMIQDLSIDFCDTNMPRGVSEFAKEVDRLTIANNDQAVYQLFADYQRAAICMCMRFDTRFAPTNTQNILAIVDRHKDNPKAHNLLQACYGLLAWNALVYYGQLNKAHEYLNKMDPEALQYKFVQATILCNELLEQHDETKHEQLAALIKDLGKTEYRLHMQGMIATFYRKKKNFDTVNQILYAMESDSSHHADTYIGMVIQSAKAESAQMAQARKPLSKLVQKPSAISNEEANRLALKQLRVEVEQHLNLVKAAFKEKSYTVGAQLLKNIIMRPELYVAMLSDHSELCEKYEKLRAVLSFIIEKTNPEDKEQIKAFHANIAELENDFWTSIEYKKEDIVQLKRSISDFSRWSAQLSQCGQNQDDNGFKKLMEELLKHPEFIKQFKGKPLKDSDKSIKNRNLYNMIYITLLERLSAYERKLNDIFFKA